MMDGRLFDVLEAVARRVRGSQAPFGGVQLILSGDFHQVGAETWMCVQAVAQTGVGLDVCV